MPCESERKARITFPNMKAGPEKPFADKVAGWNKYIVYLYICTFFLTAIDYNEVTRKFSGG